MTDAHWSLHRIGWSEPNFILQPHMSTVTVGRSLTANKQLLGKDIKVAEILYIMSFAVS